MSASLVRMKDLRKEKRLTQQDVADFIGCSAANYGRYELGMREPDL